MLKCATPLKLKKRPVAGTTKIISMKQLISILLLIFVGKFCYSQTVQVLTSGTKTSLRGLSVVDDQTIWASGSGGMVARSTNGGASFTWTKVAGFEKTEFRDIEAFDSNTAIIMAIDSPAYILKTIDGGRSWKTVYKNNTKGMFLDAMDFSDKYNGVVIGDPVGGKFFLAETKDGGNSWKELSADKRPPADSGEACFASSGTNIRSLKNGNKVFISGGLSSHFYINNKRMQLPLIQGKESTGANSVAVKDKKNLIVVGGDFSTKDSTTKNCFITHNGGKLWTAPAVAPHGYRSCVEYIMENTWLSCGLNGVDISQDGGNTFKQISKESFHVCRKAKNGNAVYFAGSNGKIGILF